MGAVFWKLGVEDLRCEVLGLLHQTDSAGLQHVLFLGLQHVAALALGFVLLDRLLVELLLLGVVLTVIRDCKVDTLGSEWVYWVDLGFILAGTDLVWLVLVTVGGITEERKLDTQWVSW